MVSRHTLVSLQRFICGCAAASLCLPWALSQPAKTPPDSRQPVLVELFTSEGCSDCPPADALLARLDSTQPIAGVEAIVLSEHVTYWNHDGWRDPFSFDDIDLRQQEYARLFSLTDVYTPQIVVDGAEQFVGSDANHLERAVVHAAQTPKAQLQIEGARLESDGRVDFSVQAAKGVKGSLIAALAQDATTSHVVRGENAGRTLHHVAVVRAIKEFGGKAVDGRALRLSGAPPENAGNAATPLRLVVFLVNTSNGHIASVAEQTLSAQAPTPSTQAAK